MKRLKTFEKFSDTMVGSIFTSDYDKSVDNIFQEIKTDFDPSKLSKNEDNGYLTYNLNGTIITTGDDTFFAIPGYTIEIDGKDIECSHLLVRKIFIFLEKKWKEKEEKITNRNLTDLGRTAKKYNL